MTPWLSEVTRGQLHIGVFRQVECTEEALMYQPKSNLIACRQVMACSDE
jgi:hypothetical protein